MTFLDKLLTHDTKTSPNTKKAFDFIDQSISGCSKWFENDEQKASAEVTKQAVNYAEEFGIEKNTKNFRLTPELKESIADYFTRCGIKCDARHVIVRPGIFDFLRDLYKAIEIEADEKVLFSLPISGYFIQQCHDNGIGVEFLNTDSKDGWKIDFAALDTILQSNKIRILFLNYPNSTTGKVLNRDEISALIKILQKHQDLLVVVDESLRDLFLHQNHEVLSLASNYDVAPQVVTISNLKCRGVGDLDFVFACLYDKLILARLFSEEVSISSANQYLAVSAMRSNDNNKKHLEDIIEQCRQNTALVKEELQSLNNNLSEKFGRREEFVKHLPTDLVNNSMLLQFDGLRGGKTEMGNKTMLTDLDVAEFLKAEAGIAMMPGQCSLLPEEEMILRLYLLKSKEELKKGFEKINQALLQLKMLKKEISSLKYNSGKGGAGR